MIINIVLMFEKIRRKWNIRIASLWLEIRVPKFSIKTIKNYQMYTGMVLISLKKKKEPKIRRTRV